MKEELYKEFVALVEKGDEEAARQFLIDHLNDFPEAMRKDIAFAFFTDAVKKDAAIAEIQKQGLELMKQADEEEKVVSDAIQVALLKEQM